MNSVRSALFQERWGLQRARELGREFESSSRAVRLLIEAIFDDDVELRKRAADVARRITEHNVKPLRRYADELAGLLSALPLQESRTRWHLGLVVARVAHTRDQRLRAARLMDLLIQDESNVVRCSAIEGLGLLAVDESSLRPIADEMIARALHSGTKAMKARARHAKRRLERVPQKND